jgi:hypothetical protein
MRRCLRLLLAPTLALTLTACGGGDDDTGAADDGATATSESSTGATADSSGDTSAADDTGSAADGTGDGIDESGADGDADVPDDLPADCTATPFDIDVTISGFDDRYPGTFTVDGVAGTLTPIVPNGDGSLDDASPSEFQELGADSDLVLATQWIGDHPFGPADVGMMSGPTPPPDAITLGLSVVPPTEAGLVVGDIVSSDDEIEFDAFTTFATVGVFLQTSAGVETYFLVDNLDETQGGTAEILYASDEWLCVAWNLAGETRNPEGTYSVSGVVLTPVERQIVPFT